jgi:hypothetical protein
MGQKTRVLLESAGDPFADPDETRFLPRFPTVRVLLTVVAASALALWLWWPARGAAPIATQDETTSPVVAKGVPRAPAPPLSASGPLAHAIVPEAAHVPEPNEDLPIGADMPDEDLPVSIPEGAWAQGSEGAKDRTHSASHERRREHGAQVARQPTNTASAREQNVAAASSPMPDRPIRQKVVRQLDF